uniref:Uncharacterized protein n=1 Tax=viral metagenome TaxID=1070528 RepID=A0A6H1Z7J3_9ZZZZ
MPTTSEIWVSGFRIAADSVGAAMLAEWKREGGTYKDLMLKSLAHFTASGEYKKELKKLGEEASCVK